MLGMVTVDREDCLVSQASLVREGTHTAIPPAGRDGDPAEPAELPERRLRVIRL